MGFIDENKITDTAAGMPITPATAAAASLSLIGRKGDPPMACCPKDGEPLISTLQYPGAEFVCMVCAGLFGFLSPTPKTESPELTARYNELKAAWDQGMKPGTSMNRSNRYKCYDTSLIVTTEKLNDRGVFAALLMKLRRNGFSVGQDKSFSWINRPDHYAGNRGDLKFKARHFPIGCEVKFYQDLVIENPNGGYYDFDREKKMPYLIRKRFHYDRSCLQAVLEKRGYVDVSDPKPRDAWEWVEQRRQGIRDFHGRNFYEGPRESYNATDADGRQLRDKDVRWFYRDNRLWRGVIFHNLNNMWWVIAGGRAHNVASFRLFTYDAYKHSFRQAEDPAASIKRKLDQAIAAQNFERAIGLRDALKRINAEKAI